MLYVCMYVYLEADFLLAAYLPIYLLVESFLQAPVPPPAAAMDNNDDDDAAAVAVVIVVVDPATTFASLVDEDMQCR